MHTTLATKTFVIDSDFKYNENGLRFDRHYTKEGGSPFDMFKYEVRSSVIKEPNGKVVFEMKEVEVPETWSQVATDILAQKYFRKAGVPQYDADGKAKINADGVVLLGPEKSMKQVAHRLAGTWRYWGEKYGYFFSQEDARIFYDELVYMLIAQMVAPNSPQWFNTGLYWAYGINGPAQGHYFADPVTGEIQLSEDAYTHPQPHACGRYDTKLFTEEGVLNLGDVVGDSKVGIKIFDGEKFIKILAVKNNGTKKLFRATLKNGNYFEFTDDHLVLTSEKRLGEGGKYDWLELRGILGNKVQQVALEYSAKNNDADDLSVAKAELAGFVVGDGYYGKYGRNGKTTLFGVITINDDEYARVAEIFTKVFGRYLTVVKKNISETYRVVKLDSKDVDDYVNLYELKNKSLTEKVPDIIMQGSKAEKTAFLRGLFQADGCVRNRHSDERNCGDVVLTSISEELMHGVQVLLLELGIYSNLSQNSEKRPDRKQSYQLSISYESERKKYAEIIGFVSMDKNEKLVKLNEEVKGKEKCVLSEETVMSVDYIGEEEVFDIQTESGKFCANGVVVHNCFIQSVRDDLVNEGGIMDLWVREARLFKYGSGTGTNFSSLRGQGEKLSGGGTSSGLMSWLKIGDRAAGAIKSGGTTRRAAKMVILNVDHPDIEDFIDWKVNEEKKVAALIAAGYDSAYEGEAYQTVSGQNSNNSVRISQEFLEAVENDADWNLVSRTKKETIKTLKAKKLWEKIAYAAWACADPGVQFDTNINDWHTCPQSGRINASNPCAEYMFLDDTACNLASINLGHYYDTEKFFFDIEGFKYTTRVWTVVLEISILMAQFPSKEIAQNSYLFRTLGLGYANIGSVLMTAGIPYDSPEAMGFAGAVTALMTAESYSTSAEMASFLGTFAGYEKNKEDMLRVMRNHRRATYGICEEKCENLTVKPTGLNPENTPAYLLTAAQESWDKTLELGNEFGFRNAQVTLLAPTGTIALLMDCATTGVEPDFSLVKFKKLAGGGYFKIVNESMPVALRVLGYTETQIDDTINYLRGHATLKNAPEINHDILRDRGFTVDDLDKIEKSLAMVFELQFAFNVWTLGEECMARLSFTSEQYNDANFNLLSALGFTSEQISAANEFVCGAMTIEDAPHLRKEHYAVFDTANKNGRKGQRYIHYLGHIRMMAAVQPFLSGAISKTINMPNEATLDDVKTAYVASWKLGLKAIALYRDGCKLSQPLSSKSKSDKKEDAKVEENKIGKVENVKAENVEAKTVEVAIEKVREITKKYLLTSKGEQVVNQEVSEENAMIKYAHDGSIQGSKIYVHGEQRKLPYKRSGLTIKTKISGQAVFLRTGEYPDGKLGEIFIDMHKEGAAFRSMLNLFAIAISTGLQYGVPLHEYVDKFTFTRFEPSGMTDHPNIKFCTSIIDFIFRVLGMEYQGRTDFVQVKPTGIQKNRAEQIARIEAILSGQAAMPLGDKVETKITQATLPNMPKVEMAIDANVAGIDQQLSGMMGDAPPCPTCGHITIRNGSCYKCLNCGSTTGCS
ncbi:MAG: adenosylcobalamin-dependent ribonucleoside-diphosphate reductase [Patescibacteria group bacterium]